MKIYKFYFILFCCCLSCLDNSKNSEIKIKSSFELLLSSETGIAFNNKIEENYQNFFDNFNYVYNGGGVAIGDINNDGLSDIYFTANDTPNKLYLNKGNFEFEDITLKAGIEGGKGWHNGVVMVDVNGDDYLDIYICRGGIKTDDETQRENLLFINQKNATFKEEASLYGLNDQGYSTHASFFDMDNDNDLDVYVTNRPDKFYIGLDDILKNKAQTNSDYRDKLFLNNKGTFEDISKQAGIVNNFGFSLSLVTSDINNDGFIDIYVANDFSENDYLYMNNGNGTFTEKIKEATNHISFYSMGTDIADINNDGYEDILVTEMLPSNYIRSKTNMPPMNTKRFKRLKEKGFHNQYMHNMLHINRGNSYFSDISQIAGVSKTDWSWSCLIADFNNDEFNDIFISNGYKRDLFDRDGRTKRKQLYKKNKGKFRTLEEMSKGLAEDIIKIYPSQEIPNHLFINNKNLTFTDQTDKWGMNTPSFSNGAAIADLDNDGDLDLVVNNVDKEAFIYKNNSRENNSYLKLKLLGPKGNSTGLGAKVKLFYNGKQQYKDFKTVRGYASSVEPILHFGLGTEKKIDTIEIIWPDGNVNFLENITVNQQIEVNYSKASFLKEKKKEIIKTLLTEETNSYFKIPFIHKENEFDDYQKQVLLPKKYSTNGPFIAVGDVNGDLLEDFYIGGASGQSGELYLQTKKQSFIKTKQPYITKDKIFEDTQSHFFDADGDDDLDLYVVSGGYEFDANSENYQDRLYLNDGKGNFKKSKGLPKITASGSCVVANDYDKDGDLDLFVGGRIVPNYYPIPAQSMILENNGKGNFVDVTKKLNPKLSKLGMVTSAVWADIDTDGLADLIVVGEWMPIKIFRNASGTFIDESEKYGLDETTTGWWNKIIVNDYDKDGDLDFIIGNLGLNHKFKASKEKPFHVYANDFDFNGNFDVFLAKYNEECTQVPVRGLDCSAEQVPVIKKKFPSFEKFAQANINDILGAGIEYGLHYKLQMFQNVIMINENGKFLLKPLPNQAQISTIQGIIADDFDGDEISDLLIAGNQFETEIETSPADASIGLLLKGGEKGKLEEISHSKSGFFVPYNVKDLKAIHLGKDKKMGYLVGINNDTLRLFVKNR